MKYMNLILHIIMNISVIPLQDSFQMSLDFTIVLIACLIFPRLLARQICLCHGQMNLKNFFMKKTSLVKVLSVSGLMFLLKQILCFVIST